MHLLKLLRRTVQLLNLAYFCVFIIIVIISFESNLAHKPLRTSDCISVQKKPRPDAAQTFSLKMKKR